jgi:hypothetical protein
MQSRASHDQQQHVTRPEKPPDRSSLHEQRRHVFPTKPLLRQPIEFELVRHRGGDQLKELRTQGVLVDRLPDIRPCQIAF